MKRLISIILSTTLVASITFGQEIRASFHDTPLPQALRTLSGKSGNWNINFIYDDIEDFRVTADINSQHPYEAVRQLVATLPVKVGIDSEHRIISVERATGNPFMNQPTTLPTVTSEAQSTQNTVMVSTPGSLSTLLTQAQKDTCTQLTVRGKLNSADIRVLRQMGGYKEEGCSTGQLQILNLADAKFVNDNEPYMMLDATKEELAAVAIPAPKSPDSGVMLGEPLQNRHVIHYEKYQHSDWADYSNYRWNGGLWVDRSELMPAKHGGAPYYYGKYALGRSIDRKFRYVDEQFYFSHNFNEENWKLFKRRGIEKFKGHKIEKVDDRYILRAYTRKNFFPDDMFFKCKNLQCIIMPKSMRIDDEIIKDETSCIKYYLPYNELTIRYFRKHFRRWTLFPPYMLNERLKAEKKIKFLDQSSEGIINILHNLKPMDVDWKKFKIDVRARFFVEYADDREPEDYYIDLDNKHVQKGDERKTAKFFKASKELLALMKELGII